VSARDAARPVIVAMLDDDGRGGRMLDVCATPRAAERAAALARVAYGAGTPAAARVVLAYPAPSRAVWGVARRGDALGDTIDWHESRDDAERAAAAFLPGVATVVRFSDGRWRAAQ